MVSLGPCGDKFNILYTSTKKSERRRSQKVGIIVHTSSNKLNIERKSKQISEILGIWCISCNSIEDARRIGNSPEIIYYELCEDANNIIG